MSSGIPITFLYEDRRGPTKGFGLHKFIKACVFDEVDGIRHEFERLLRDHRPMKGNANLLRTCQRDLDIISHDGRHVVAVFDADGVRRLLNMSFDAHENEVVDRIKDGCPAPETLSIFILDENIETVIRDIFECDPSIGEILVQKALEKQLEARDAVFDEASRSTGRTLRDCVLERNHSLNNLVTHVCEMVRQVVL